MTNKNSLEESLAFMKKLDKYDYDTEKFREALQTLIDYASKRRLERPLSCDNCLDNSERYREALEKISKGGWNCNFQEIAKSALEGDSK